MANQYKIFRKGFSLIPKAASLDGPYNSIKGDIELLTSTNKLYFHNGTINDPIVQENVQATLTNKTLTSPVLNTPTADTITGIAGGALTVQSASNQNLSLQAQGTGTVTLESLTVDGSNVSASTDIAFNQTSGNTYFKVTGTSVVRVDSDGIAFLSQNDAKFYDATNTNYVNVQASNPTASYPITLPAAAPTANTALVYDGTQYKWGAAGGADSAGANDDILATAFRARILDSFDDAPTASSSTINSATTTATHVPNNQLYTIQYINTTITGANTTTPVITPVGGYTLQENDAVVLGSEVRFLNASLGINTPFTLSSGSCVVSKTVSSKELYNSTFDGDSISDAFNASSFSEYLVDYQDSTTAIYETSIAPKVSYSVSQDGSTWSNFASRPQYQTDQIDSGSFASPGTNLYVRLFANFNTIGSGTINLLEYRAYMQKSPIVASGTVNQAYTRLAFPAVGQQKGCTLLDPAGYGGKSAIQLNWDYSVGVNPTLAYGALDVYINGQIIPRFIDSTTTNGAYYTENSSKIIVLDSNYSATPYAIQVIQRQPMGNYTSSTGGSSSSTGDGLKNYLTTYNNNPGNGNFETGDTSGWGLFNTTLTSLIPTGSITAGASSISTFSAVATTPLAGTYSLSIATSSTFIAGQGFISNAFTIDREDRAKVLAFNFSYEVVSGASMVFSGTSANTWAIYLHDGTSWIQPAGVYGMVQSTGVGYVTGTFQTGATATQYRLAVVCINGGVAGSLKFDDFFVGPQISVNAPAMSDWSSNYTFTPNNFGTPTTFAYRSRRVGDSLQVVGNFTPTATSANIASISLPAGLTIDSTKLPSAASGTIVGQFSGNETGAGRNIYYASTSGGTSDAGVLFYDGSDTSKIYLTSFSASNALNKANSNNWNVSPITFEMTLPIAGWSSNTVASNDTDTRVVAARIGGTPANTIANGIIIYPTVSQDTHGAYNATTGRYTIPVSGYYQIFAAINCTVTTSGTLYAALDGNLQSPTMGYVFSTAGTGSGSTTIYANAGQLLDVRFGQALTGFSGTANGLSITRVSGPAVINASESVNASYSVSTLFTAGTSTPINFDTKEFDSHNAVTTSPTAWRFTAPISGTYQVSHTSGSSTANVVLLIRKNGTAYKFLGQTPGVGLYNVNYTSLRLNAGEYIDICPSAGSPQFYGGALNSGTNIFTISRIGN